MGVLPLRSGVRSVREFLLKDIREGSVIRVRIPALDVETDMKVFYIKDLGTYFASSRFCALTTPLP